MRVDYHGLAPCAVKRVSKLAGLLPAGQDHERVPDALAPSSQQAAHVDRGSEPPHSPFAPSSCLLREAMQCGSTAPPRQLAGSTEAHDSAPECAPAVDSIDAAGAASAGDFVLDQNATESPTLAPADAITRQPPQPEKGSDYMIGQEVSVVRHSQHGGKRGTVTARRNGYLLVQLHGDKPSYFRARDLMRGKLEGADATAPVRARSPQTYAYKCSRCSLPKNGHFCAAPMNLSAAEKKRKSEFEQQQKRTARVEAAARAMGIPHARTAWLDASMAPGGPPAMAGPDPAGEGSAVALPAIPVMVPSGAMMPSMAPTLLSTMSTTREQLQYQQQAMMTSAGLIHTSAGLIHTSGAPPATMMQALPEMVSPSTVMAAPAMIAPPMVGWMAPPGIVMMGPGGMMAAPGGMMMAAPGGMMMPGAFMGGGMMGGCMGGMMLPPGMVVPPPMQPPAPEAVALSEVPVVQLVAASQEASSSRSVTIKDSLTALENSQKEQAATAVLHEAGGAPAWEGTSALPLVPMSVPVPVATDTTIAEASAKAYSAAATTAAAAAAATAAAATAEVMRLPAASSGGTSAPPAPTFFYSDTFYHPPIAADGGPQE